VTSQASVKRGPAEDEVSLRAAAAQLESEHPAWIVIFGFYSREFVCFPRFDAPSGTPVIARYPPAAAHRMRAIEDASRRIAGKEGQRG